MTERALPETPGRTDVAAIFRTRLDSNRLTLAKLDRQGAWIANFRVATFLGAVAAGALAWEAKVPGGWGWSAASVFFTAYVVLVAVHRRILSTESRERILESLNARGLSRLDGTWHAFPGRGDRFLDPGHPYIPDLDVFGPGSLFQLIDESGTIAGEDRLAAWLSSPAALSVIQARQLAIAELGAMLDFRQQLIVESRLAAKDKADPARFIAWGEGLSMLQGIRWARPLAWVLPVAFAAAATLAHYDLVSPVAPWTALGALVAVIGVTRSRIKSAYDAISAGQSGFVRFENVFDHVRNGSFQDPSLRALSEQMGTSATLALRAFSRRFAFAELRQSHVHPIVNLFTLWDVHWMFALERWRKAYGSSVRKWFDALAELEALSSLAGFAHGRPDFCVPSVSDDALHLDAKGLGHPLLQDPVRNDVSFPTAGYAYVVTGSNMSGKSTLLRALGTNVVLALAGAPVCASAFSMSALRVLTGMRVKDSLERGVSYFYAEVQRIKLLMDEAKAAQGRALFLLDEILLGTNARERQVASREILRLFLETGAIGLVATHDFTLSSMEGQGGLRIRNVHFEDQIVDGRMTFDYRLRDGVVQQTNALRVLHNAGIDVRAPNGDEPAR
jgi:hypothetical protein